MTDTFKPPYYWLRDEEYAVKAKTGEERWLAEIEGGAVADLAGRSYTLLDILLAIQELVKAARLNNVEYSGNLKVVDLCKNTPEVTTAFLEGEYIKLYSALKTVNSDYPIWVAWRHSDLW